MEERVIHISTKTIWKLLAVGVLLYLAYLVRNILLILFVCLIFSELIAPFATWFQKKKVPRALSVLIIYFIFLGLLTGIFYLLTPVIAHDVPAFLKSMGNFWSEVQQHPLWQQFFGSSAVGALPASADMVVAAPAAALPQTFSGMINYLGTIFGGIFSFLLILVITFYMVVQEDPVGKMLHSFVPEKYIASTLSLLKQIREKLGAWMRAQLILSLIVGLLIFLGLLILGVPYAAVLASLSALFEFVPYVGPIFATIPAAFFGLASGGITQCILVIVLYIVVQQTENHFLTPKVMQRAVGLNPIISIIAILIGMKIAGVLGALLSLPVATAMSVVTQNIFNKKYENETSS